MPRTRSTKANASDDAETSSNTPSATYTLPAQTENIPKVFILPKKANQEARIVTLPNPRHHQPSRYLVCPETGVYEFVRIAAPKTTPHSWLLETPEGLTGAKAENSGRELQAQVIKGAELYIASAFDPLFLVLPVLADANVARGDEKKRLFLASDDHFDKLPEESSHLSEILRCRHTRALIEDRMGEICDVVDAGDENMFRLNEDKLFQAVMKKAKKMSDWKLPPSMEEKFVTKALEAPILVQTRSLGISDNQTPTNGSVDSGVSTPVTESTDSQSTSTSADTSASAASQISTAATSVVEEPAETNDIVKAMEASPQIIGLQRLRVSFDFICGSYIPNAVAEELRNTLSSAESCSIDFKPLDEYLAKLVKLRSDAVSARSIGDYSRKRGRDEEEDEARAEKKRKMEEEKKRKASESRGVRDLKKVNTTGMMKLSSFFKKK